jgi:hypothetical protein
MNSNPSGLCENIDGHGWRSVVTGLRILLLACAAAPAAVALAIVLLCVLFLMQDDPRLAGQGALYLLCGGLVLGMIAAAVGLGYCCRVPPASGARGPLLWAIALVAIGGTLLLLSMFIEVYLFPLAARPPWSRGRLIRLALQGGSVGSLAAGCLSWLLFLRAIANALGNEPLSRGLQVYAIGFAVWAGIAIASLWLVEMQDRENVVLVAFASVNMMLGFGHAAWMLGLLATVSEAIEAALPSKERGKPGPRGRWSTG